MKLILQDGELEVDMSDLVENFGFFELFDEMTVKDDTLNMSSLPITKFGITQLLSLCKKGEINIENISDTMSTLKIMKHTHIFLDTLGDKGKLLDNGHVYNRLCLNKSCPDFYNATVLETNIRREIAQGKIKPFSSLIEITKNICKDTKYTPLDDSCPLLFDQIKTIYTKKYQKDDFVMTLREPNCDTIKKILSLGNVVIAGGYPLEQIAAEKTKGSDVDMFMWGITEAEADLKLQEISDIIGGDPYCTGNAYTFAYRVGGKLVGDKLTSQVVLRLYETPDEILHGFDIQACKVLMCMDNRVIKYYGTPSFIECMKYNAIWIDTERQSSTYAVRLIKYFCKGFDVLMTGYKKDFVDNSIMLGEKADIRKNKGFALLLRYEHEICKYFYASDGTLRCTYRSNKRDYRTIKYRLNHILQKVKQSDCDYQDNFSIMRTGGDFFNFLRRAWRFPNYLPIVQKMGWSFVKRGTMKLPKATWNTRDPSSQTVIGSFHPEQEDYYQQAFNVASFSLDVLH